MNVMETHQREIDQADWRTVYYSVVLGLEARTYFAGLAAHERAVESAVRDAKALWPGSAAVRLEKRRADGGWLEVDRFEYEEVE